MSIPYRPSIFDIQGAHTPLRCTFKSVWLLEAGIYGSCIILNDPNPANKQKWELIDMLHIFLNVCRIFIQDYNLFGLHSRYCNPIYDFPSQEDILEKCVGIATRHTASNPKTLIVVGSYTIGKFSVHFHFIFFLVMTLNDLCCFANFLLWLLLH